MAGGITPPQPGTRPTLGLHLFCQGGDGSRTAIVGTDVAVADQAGDKGETVRHQRFKQAAAVEATIQTPGALAADGSVDGADMVKDLGLLTGRCSGVGLEQLDHRGEHS